MHAAPMIGARNETLYRYGVTITVPGIGDALQFSSLPENYFRSTGQKLLDLSRSWIFDHNPFVVRDAVRAPLKSIELWNFGHRNKWPFVTPRGERRPKVYLSNAEIWANALGVKTFLNRPRLYVHEDFPFPERRKIILHAHGKSHGKMPDHVIRHVIKKYGPTGDLVQVGLYPVAGIPHIETKDLWDLARVISSAKMFIGVDSGPSWIAACYPDIILKVVRTKPTPETFDDWVPLEAGNIHSHWDDRCRHTYNTSERDHGFTSSYLRI